MHQYDGPYMTTYTQPCCWCGNRTSISAKTTHDVVANVVAWFSQQQQHRVG